ncbi:AAA family ATPase [Pseudomonas lurida]|uniref:ATP-binding protein n=1 Tax=Pseudomonas lurida TaxID=244566 RepID=UPI00177FDCA5|nr:ATP-binding protein [Pseudomonas lurida]MBD8668380.1 AAA family ATPase [Pseudomonas lurida]UZQ73356.1 AAA family ATPase [Pseudomonas lurida]
MRVRITQKYKSIPAGLEFDLPEFSILTGKNGSGKSHLLEVMANPQMCQVVVDGKVLTNILHVGYNGLNPQVDERCDSSQLVQNASHWWAQINSVIHHYKSNYPGGGHFQDVFKDYVLTHFGHEFVRNSVLKNVMDRSGKKLEDITELDVYSNMTFSENNNGTLFFSQCAMIFKAYHLRWRNNKFNKFLVSEESTDGLTFLSDDEFLKKNGPPPWDLINEILSKAALPYEFPNPNLGDADLAYNLKLVDRTDGTEISVNDLSSGEKVLMSLALAIYNSKEGGSRPELLLLDEPDAPLHPQYSRLLIETVVETIVERAGVNVVMTTHSPATAAMAPINSLYEVSREFKTPIMVSNSRAVSILTQGIGFLRVSYERRRQVFVESKYDVFYFEKLFDALARKYMYSYQPVFMEPHSGKTNCSDVIAIVERLRQSGNDLVWGIVDFDGVNQSRGTLLVLGENKRYAIENYLLDPLYIVLALIRYHKAKYLDFGVSTRTTYPDAAYLTQSECQTMIDDFMLKIGFALDDLLPVTLENGFELLYPKSILMHQGHDYETLVQSRVPELKAISRGQGDSALKLALAEVIAEFPQFIPTEIGNLFASMDEPR